MFAALPSGFPKLQLAVQDLRRVAVERPPDIRALGLRLRTLYAAARASGYSALLLGSVRKLPYAYYLDAQPCLVELEPDLVRRYWQESLPTALRQARRAKRWYSPIFFTYCQEFQPQSTRFREFAANALSALEVHSDEPYAEAAKGIEFFPTQSSGDGIGQRTCHFW